MSGALWTSFEAAAATGGALCARGGDDWSAEEWSAEGVSIDTRTLKRGEIFVALSDARDGHEFVRNAFESGATAALVARAPTDAPQGAPLLVVGDTLDALRDLAAAARNRNFGRRIGITGSVGKTSAKEMLRVALAPTGKVHAADKSYNNHWGVPLTLARLPMDADFGVFEIGMNHAGEITPLTRLVQPHVAIVTTVAAAHLEFFGTTERIAEAKAEIFLGVAPDGAAVLPADNEHFALLRARASEAGIQNLITFGESPVADLRLLAYDGSDDRAEVRAEIFGQAHSFVIGAPGKHQALNALAVIAAATAADAELEPTLAALAGFGAAEGRGARQTIPTPDGGSAVLIDESYNANPVSMAASLALLGAQGATVKRRVAVLGEMLELGPSGPALHAALAGNLVAAKVDRLYAAGEQMRHLWAAAPAGMRGEYAVTAADLVGPVLSDLRNGDAVMVKGSNGSRVSVVARALQELATAAVRPAAT